MNLDCLPTSSACDTSLADQLLQGQALFLNEHSIPDSLRNGEARILSTPEQAQRYLQMRGDVFLKDSQRRYANLDPQGELFVEPCDFDATHSWFERDGKVLYAIRMQSAPSALNNANYVDLQPLLAGRVSARDVLMTRFFTPRAQKAGFREVFALFQLNYEIAMRCEKRFGFLTCSPLHAKFFSKIGFAPIDAYQCRFSGEQKVMAMDIWDRENLVRSKSPLVAVNDRVIAEIGGAPPTNPKLNDHQGDAHDDRQTDPLEG
ncbi:MAG: hypothetical protein R3D60_09250 [Paracoccaceae bacterium]